MTLKVMPTKKIVVTTFPEILRFNTCEEIPMKQKNSTISSLSCQEKKRTKSRVVITLFSLLGLLTTTFPQKANALNFSELDPTNPKSEINRGLANIKPTNPNSNLKQSIAFNPFNCPLTSSYNRGVFSVEIPASCITQDVQKTLSGFEGRNTNTEFNRLDASNLRANLASNEIRVEGN